MSTRLRKLHFEGDDLIAETLSDEEAEFLSKNLGKKDVKLDGQSLSVCFVMSECDGKEKADKAKAALAARKPSNQTAQPKYAEPHRVKIAEVSDPDVVGFAKALAKAGFTYADEVYATAAADLESAIKDLDRLGASKLKHALYQALNPQGAPPPGTGF